MLSRILNVFHKWLASAERDRIEQKFQKIDNDLSHVDTRIDGLEMGQSEIKSQLKSIHEVGLANLEALEEKLNSNKVSNEVTREMFTDRFEYMKKSFERLETLFTSSYCKKGD